ncbi:hypothetical protein VRY85_11345 [Achromobacter sp. F4_2707]|uniref:SecDF P1 head subdomain-containing protein n=1 Tax=Achromobacter sp. F4_2707 TaxID=3114286 RepID=UPI0039C71270
MKVTRILTRSTLALALLTLAACQTAPEQQQAATQPADTTVATPTPPSSTVDDSQVTQPAAEQGAPVAVFVADMVQQEGWLEVAVGGDSKLYLSPQPVVTRADLTGVQAGADQQAQGLLALILSDEARARVQEATSRNPNKRLALVVGRTLMAAPSYTEQVNSDQLIFPVGTESNATAAARAIAGVDENGVPLPPASGQAAPQ